MSERHPKPTKEILFSDFGVSYKEVSDLGKLIKNCAPSEHKIIKPGAK